MEVRAGEVRWGTPAARWVLTATVLGSGVAFLDGTVVNIALPHIAADFDAGLAGLQWVLDGYLVALSALILLGGSLGDLFGRRRTFLTGLAGFTAASALCGLAPTLAWLVAARVLQGVAGALLVPGSLALVSACFHPDDRGRAVGAWSGLGGVATAAGPFVGGWLVDAVSWRPVFLINVPLAAVAGWSAWRHVPESREANADRRVDITGAALVSVGLAVLTAGLIESIGVLTVLGLALLAVFVLVEAHQSHPLLPLGLFRSTQFSGTNATTFAVYGALGVALFLVVLQLQNGLGYSALEAGCALLPLTVVPLFLSSRAGAMAQRVGPRLFMAVGPLVVGAGLLLFGRVQPGSTYVDAVLPATLVFGLGLAILVGPLTATVLAAVDTGHTGTASGVNTAVARLAGLLAVAVLPGVAGIEDVTAGHSLGPGYVTALRIAAVLCAIGAVIGGLTAKQIGAATPAIVPLQHACNSELAAGSSYRNVRAASSRLSMS